MRVAVTGARGRLGRALIEALENAPFTGTARADRRGRARTSTSTRSRWSRSSALIERDKPEIVIHAAAWTDVDGCARDPDLALRRNADATGSLAQACADRGIQLVLVSTNEVFDGERRDGRGYGPDDPRRAINAYGAEQARRRGRSSRTQPRRVPPLAIARTSWLHGPPGNDFPEKIARAALRARDAGEPLRVVGDEIGTPTYTPDVADAIVELIWENGLFDDTGTATIHHLVNGGRASRADWAREVLRATGIDVDDRGGSRLDLAAGEHPAPVGRPRAHAAPVGRADARLAARVRGRGPGPEAGARASRLKRRASI